MRHFVKIKGGRWRSSGFYFSNRLPSVLDTLDTSGRNKKKFFYGGNGIQVIT